MTTSNYIPRFQQFSYFVYHRKRAKIYNLNMKTNRETVGFLTGVTCGKLICCPLPRHHSPYRTIFSANVMSLIKSACT